MTGQGPLPRHHVTCLLSEDRFISWNESKKIIPGFVRKTIKASSPFADHHRQHVQKTCRQRQINQLIVSKPTSKVCIFTKCFRTVFWVTHKLNGSDPQRKAFRTKETRERMDCCKFVEKIWRSNSEITAYAHWWCFWTVQISLTTFWCCWNSKRGNK